MSRVTKLLEVASTSAEVATTSSRSAKTKRLAALLRTADIDDVRAIVAWLSGDLLQRRIGVGWATLAALPAPSQAASLEVAAVNRAFAEMAELSGAGSQGRRSALVEEVFGNATETEQAFLRGLLSGGLRQGALAGVMSDAIAAAANVPAADVRRAVMLSGDLSMVADAALRDGATALGAFRLEVGRPLAPMLAQSATSVEDAIDHLEGPVAFEAKLDGARIQVHRSGDEVKLFTRSLDEITARLPGIVNEVRSWGVSTIVADGEILAIGDDARPMMFQETASHVSRRRKQQGDEGGGDGDGGDAGEGALQAPPDRLRVFLFDLLHLDGTDLIDRPASERRAALESLALSKTTRVDRVVTRDPVEARAFFDRMVRLGYEGVVAKAESAPYEAGRRGASWLKVKPVLTLDLVVLGVEWGSGRRRGKLSNIPLGARDPGGGFVMLGKTFKGMTDAMLEWQTRRFLELADGPTDGYVVKVRPEQVVEIAFDGVQVSSRYPGKVALRFARVLRYRDDKTAAEADTIDAVRAVLTRNRGDEGG